MITIEPHHYKIVTDILSRYKGYDFYAFGSRTKGNPKKFSDLDICILQPAPLSVVGNLKEDFENSRLPYKVDIVLWQRCSAEFQSLIKDDLVKITLPESV